MTYRKIKSPLQYTFCSMEFFLQLDIILPVVYKNNMVNFCPLYQSINIWDRTRWTYMDPWLIIVQVQQVTGQPILAQHLNPPGYFNQGQIQYVQGGPGQQPIMRMVNVMPGRLPPPLRDCKRSFKILNGYT